MCHCEGQSPEAISLKNKFILEFKLYETNNL